MSQPDPDDFLRLAELGFTTLINVRDDDEAIGQLGTNKERIASAAAALRYLFIPVSEGTIAESDVRAFRTAIATSEGPTVAHCESGGRALALFAIGEALEGRLGDDDIEHLGLQHGLNLSLAIAWLEKHRNRRTHVEAFFEEKTSSIQYVASDPLTLRCAIVDPVLNFDEKSGSTSTSSADEILCYVRQRGLVVDWILDTHPHADHFSAAQYLKEKTGAPVATGSRISVVQRLWKKIYNWSELQTDGSQWDALLSQKATFSVGSIAGEVIYSPGHTLASCTFVVGDAAFIHDTLFMPDSGTARADFPGADPRMLWHSIQQILSLPEDTRLFTGHDYQPLGRVPKWESTVAAQARSNIHIAGKLERDFIRLRTERDRTLEMPSLILHALQVNLRAGRLPDPDLSGKRFLKFPLNALG
jgi:uncharacterized protein (TIGR01244 family)